MKTPCHHPQRETPWTPLESSSPRHCFDCSLTCIAGILFEYGIASHHEDRKSEKGVDGERMEWLCCPKKRWEKKVSLGAVGMNVLPNGKVWWTVFTQLPKQKGVNRWLCLFLFAFIVWYIHDMYFIFMSNICMCINMYIYIHINYIYSTLYLCGCNENWEETSWRHWGVPIITFIVIMAVIIINNINHIEISIDVRNAPCPTTRLSWFNHLQVSLVGYSLC